MDVSPTTLWQCGSCRDDGVDLFGCDCGRQTPVLVSPVPSFAFVTTRGERNNVPPTSVTCFPFILSASLFSARALHSKRSGSQCFGGDNVITVSVVIGVTLGSNSPLHHPWSGNVVFDSKVNWHTDRGLHWYIKYQLSPLLLWVSRSLPANTYQ